MELFIAVCSIMMVNIVLSGDNAVVIAMASRCLWQGKREAHGHCLRQNEERCRTNDRSVKSNPA